MKYWRGYLVAAILAAGTWGLRQFAAAHTVLVDMVYPYVSRMIQTYLAQWSSEVSFCVWQTVLLALGAVVLASFVLMLILKWNPIQWFGWVLAGASLMFLLNTGLYGLNEYAGPLADDVRLQDAEYAYTVSELVDAAEYYREYANALSTQVKRDENGQVQIGDFETAAAQAAEGFQTLAYDQHYAVFAGSTLPVKKLSFGTGKTTTGKMMPLTGEAAVNPDLPAVCLPYAMCKEMARRMCITRGADADFAAFMACDANSSAEFRYAGYLMAYRACYRALEAVSETTGNGELSKLAAGQHANVDADMRAYDKHFGKNAAVDGEFCDLLVVWHIQKITLPSKEVEEEVFDPLDENQVDLNGLVNAPVGTDGADE